MAHVNLHSVPNQKWMNKLHVNKLHMEPEEQSSIPWKELQGLPIER